MFAVSLLILKYFTPWPRARLNRAARWVWRHEPLSAEAFFETAFEGHATDSEFCLLALERYLGSLSLALVAAGLYVIVVCLFTCLSAQRWMVCVELRPGLAHWRSLWPSP
jgi:hypothetical protein